MYLLLIKERCLLLEIMLLNAIYIYFSVIKYVSVTDSHAFCFYYIF